MAAPTRPEWLITATALTGRLEQHGGTSLNWDQVREAAAHPLNGLTKAQLRDVCAYLGAQVVGLRNSTDREALLAINQIKRIVKDYTDRNPDQTTNP